MILKNKEGKVRLIWHLVMLVVPFLLAAYLLRFIPIRIQAGILVGQGFSESAALSQAGYIFLEHPIGESIVGTLQGLLWYVLVCILTRSIEKQPCSLKSFGLSGTRKSLMLVAVGFLLGLIMYISYFAIGDFFGQPPFTWSPAKLAILPIILISLNMLSNGFGEETAFRAYWQRLLVDRHGLWFGIILASTSFVLLHLLISRLTVPALLAGILLAFVFGILYVWTDSVFLVGVLHATLNWAPRLLGPWPSDISLLIVNGLTLVIVLILYLWVVKATRTRMTGNNQHS